LTDRGGTGIGAELARAREAQGLALMEVAQQLKFAPRQLEALEQERFDRLPGATIARGMLRNYARLLKLDPEPLLERLAGQLDTPDATQLAARFRQPVPFSDGARRATMIYIGASVVVLAFVGAVAYEWHQERKAPQFVAPAAEAPRPPPLAAQTAALAPPPAVEKKEPEKKPAAVAAVAAATAPPAGGLQRIVLRCEEEAWLEVRDGAGRVVVSSLNPAGSERVVRGRPPFELVIGNAAHVQLTYNERPIDLQPFIRVEVARLTLK
jgi:cytoskeleton protein RodZ